MVVLIYYLKELFQYPQARDLASGMAKRRLAEADVLNERILLCSTCAVLRQAEFNSMQRAELATQLTVLTRNGVPLPFPLRCQSLVRQCDDLLRDAMELEKLADSFPLLQKAISKLLWQSGDPDMDDEVSETNVTASWMVSDLEEDLSTMERLGKLSPEQAVQEKAKCVEAHLGGTGLIEWIQ